MKERPWMELREFAPLFGLKPTTALNKIACGEFPITTYKLGKKVVADKEVVERFFAAKRAEGLRALGEST